MRASRHTFPLLAELLSEQQRLDTPVARFAGAHEAAGLGAETVALAPQLIPLSAPGPGEQYAFEVDLDSCTGCKSCVAACHALNGLEEQETWRDVGLVIGGDRRHPFSQTITSACHHCADPACLNGCPVLAYEKDPLTGIVRHLDDQCIGCSYCILKCPYDVPKFSERLGIVRKCDMCHGRLAHGEAPGCVQACPTHAIRITKVPTGIASPAFLAAAAEVSYTQPTTRYVTQRQLPADAVAADAGEPRVQPAHWALVGLLTLVPIGVGGSVAAAALRVAGLASLSERLAVAAVVMGLSGVAVGTAHLGQPLRAWRIFLGLRTSWLSREGVLFGGWLAAAVLTLTPLPAAAKLSLATTAALIGVAGLFCSMMIYIDTRRRLWRPSQTVPRFAGTAALGALATTIACASGIAAANGITVVASGLLIATLLVKLLVESGALSPLAASPTSAPSPELNTVRLLRGPLRSLHEARIACAIASGCIAYGLCVTGGASAPTLFLFVAVVFAGELLDRLLFFRAVDAPKMPGMPGGKA